MKLPFAQHGKQDNEPRDPGETCDRGQKDSPIRVTAVLTEDGGLPMIVLPGLAKAVLTKSEAQRIRSDLDKMLKDDFIVWAEEVDWEAVRRCL